MNTVPAPGSLSRITRSMNFCTPIASGSIMIISSTHASSCIMPMLRSEPAKVSRAPCTSGSGPPATRAAAYWSAQAFMAFSSAPVTGYSCPTAHTAPK